MTDTPQTLFEFTNNLIADLVSGAITAHEALTAAQQYAYLRDELRRQENDLGPSLLEGGDAFTSALIAAFQRVRIKLQELPNFQSQEPDRPSQETAIRDVSALRAFAIDRIKNDTRLKISGLSEKRRGFVHDLVNKFSSTNPAINEKSVNAAIDQALAAPTIQRFANQLATNLSIAETAVNTNSSFITSVTQFHSNEANIVSALLDNTDIKRPDVFVDVVLHAPQAESEENVLLRATKLARVAQALEGSFEKKRGKLRFFSTDGAKGVAGGLQKGADGILSLLGEPVREMILAEKVNGTLRSMLTNTQKFTDRVGETFIHSAFFSHVAKDLTKQMGEKMAVKGQARTIFDDLVSSIFRGPLQTPLQLPTQDRILDYFELARANAAAPKKKSFLVSGIPFWDTFRAPVEPGSAPSWQPGQGHRSTALSWLPMVGFGTFIGNAFSSFVDRITSFFFTSPFLPKQLHASRRAAALPIPLSDDMPLLVSLVVVIVLVLYFIFPSFFNLPQLSHSAKVSALFAALQRKGEGFHDDSREFPIPDFGPIKHSPNACILYGKGTAAPDGRKSYQLSSSQQDRMNDALKTYPQIGLFACILGCPENAVNFTAFNASSPDGYWAWAPSAQPGDIFLYDGAFSSSSTRSLARLIAHELAHQIKYFRPNIYNSYLGKGYCGPLGTYSWVETPSETFAEAAGMYMIGDPLLKQKCEAGYKFMDDLFSQCR